MNIRNGLLLLFPLLAIVACKLPVTAFQTGPNLTEDSRSRIGQASVKMFVPDYVRLSGNSLGGRAIPPQAAQIRLSLQQADGSFLTVQDLSLALNGTWTTVVGSSSFPGAIWEGTFNGLAQATYPPGSLRVEILDAASLPVSSGFNSVSVGIEAGQKTTATFFTLPTKASDQNGSLLAGEMKFWKTSLSPYVAFDLSVATTGTGGMPDIVVFDELGRFYQYSGASTGPSATHTLVYPRGGTYYIGVWADAGAVDSYSLTLAAAPAGFFDGFETGDTSSQPWVLSSVGPSATPPTVVSAVSTAAASGEYSLGFASRNMTTGGRSRATIQASPAQDSTLSFRIKTDIGTDVSTSLKLSIDGVVAGSWNGLGGSWTLKTIPVTAGTHTFLWALEKDSGSYYPSATNKVWLDDIALKTKYPVTLSDLDEGFESGGFDRYAWVPSGNIAPTVPSSTFYEGTKATTFATRSLTSGQISSLAVDVNPAQASAVSFWMKTDIGTDVSTSFQFLLDGVKLGEWNGLGEPWTQETFLVPAGLHSLEWRAVKSSGYYYPSATNAVFLDKITLIPDQASTVLLRPRGDLDFFVGMAPQRFEASALRSDGSIKSSSTFTFSVASLGGMGTIDSSGLFTPTAPGTCRVTALSSEGLRATSRTITIHPDNFMRLPVTYAGATYAGKTEVGSGSPLTGSVSGLSVTWPDTASFTADGFFTLEGSISNPSVYNYCYVSVVKDATSESTNYFPRNDFKTRIWLRFGPGAYTVKVMKLTSLGVDLAGEGDFNSWGWSSTPVYTYHVTNTRAELGTYLYPSDPIQSDNYGIANIQRDLTYGLTDSRDKVKAIHDYVVKFLYYDDASLVTDQRKKQDTISTLINRTGVCEGYVSLTNALLRSAALPAKAVSGDAGEAHAWTNVLIDGTWFFLDSTWDDPGPNDADPTSISYKYFLLTSMTGVGGDHTPQDLRPDRAVGSSLPTWRGYPAGSY